METKAQLAKLTNTELTARAELAHREEIAAQNRRDRRTASKLVTLQARISEVQAARQAELDRKARERAIEVGLRRARRAM